MRTAFFQHITRCLFEPFAILGLIGFLLFCCRRWKKDKGETLLFAFALFFMLAWRTIMPINADRYALLLIPVAIFFSLEAVREIAGFFRRFFRFPEGRFLFPVLLLLCLGKSFHSTTEDRYMFDMIRLLKEKTENDPRPVRVVSNRDLSCFLGDGFEVVCHNITGPFRYSELPQADYYLLKLNAKKTVLDPDIPAQWIIRPACGKSCFLLRKGGGVR